MQPASKRSIRSGAAHLYLSSRWELKPWLATEGVTNVVELDWWQSHTYKGVEFYLTPVQHWSSRTLFDRMQTLWGGFAVFAPNFHYYYSGDSAYSKDFTDTRSHFTARQSQGGFDLAQINIGCYEPRWLMKDEHVNPLEAAQVHMDIGAKRSVGVHWGTFGGHCEPIDQAPKDLLQARKTLGLQDDEFFVLKIGETRRLPKRQPD